MNVKHRKYVPTASLDEVIAGNLERLREQRKQAGLWYSRRALAEQVNGITGGSWTQQKIGGIERDHVPVAWPDLVALALAFDVKLYELVLPADDETKVEVGRASQVEVSEFPLDEAIPEHLRGTKKTKTVAYVHRSNRDELSLLLFGLPGDWVTSDYVDKIVDGLNVDVVDALADIANLEQGLANTIAKLKQAVLDHEQQKGDA